MDLGVDNGQVIPPSRKFLINAGVQLGVFVHCHRAALPAKLLIAKIPEMPLSLDWPSESGCEPAKGSFPAACGETTFVLQAEPFDVPPADEEIVPSNHCLLAQGRADRRGVQVEADGCASPDAQKEFGD